MKKNSISIKAATCIAVSSLLFGATVGAAGTSVFSDVSPDAWYANSAKWANEIGLVKGIDGKFVANGNVTRAQLVTILQRYDAHLNNMMAKKYDFNGVLSDVSGGKASGTVGASYKDNKYTLHAQFSNLPALKDNYFYEGWVVKKNPLDVVSTGALTKENDEYVNTFTSDKDYSEHLFYVLTLEPNDGDPAPAGHILEGTMK